MGQICSDTGRVHDIIKSQMGDQTRLLQEEGQGLADSTSGTANRNWVDTSRVKKKRWREERDMWSD
jgi:hypothetical protein